MATSGRDARRRRIVDRGTDRLALITGRVQGLPESESESRHSHTASCPPSLSRDHAPSYQTSLDSIIEDDASGLPSPNNYSSIEPVKDKNNDYDSNIRATPYMRKYGSNIETSSAPALDLDDKEQPFYVSSPLHPHLSASDGSSHLKPQSSLHDVFSPNKISSAIAASESIRFNFSLVAAILVLLSYNSRFFKLVMFFRPLFLLLLSNISIIIARLLVERGSVQNQQAARVSPSTGGDMVDQIGKALEIGLLLQSSMSALLMDCSIYSVTVICGLSVAQMLGW